MFRIHDRENNIKLSAGRAFDYIKEMKTEEIEERLKEAISWNGHLEMSALEPIDTSEMIGIYSDELKYREVMGE